MLLAPFYKWGNRHREIDCLPRVTHLENGWVGVCAQEVWHLAGSGATRALGSATSLCKAMWDRGLPLPVQPTGAAPGGNQSLWWNESHELFPSCPPRKHLLQSWRFLVSSNKFGSIRKGFYDGAFALPKTIIHVGAHGSELNGKMPRGGGSLGKWQHHQPCSTCPSSRWSRPCPMTVRRGSLWGEECAETSACPRDQSLVQGALARPPPCGPHR